jgi:hypothetical protein
MANLTVQPVNNDPLNLQGGSPVVAAVPSVQPANSQPAATANVLQPAGPTTVPATTVPQNPQTTTPAAVVPSTVPATTPAPVGDHQETSFSEHGAEG